MKYKNRIVHCMPIPPTNKIEIFPTDNKNNQHDQERRRKRTPKNKEPQWWFVPERNHIQGIRAGIRPYHQDAGEWAL